MPLFKDIRQLKIVTLASKTRFEKGEFGLSFDVMKNTDYDKITEKRRKEAESYEELPCVMGTCSGDIEMELIAKKCCFNFTVEGALKPSTELQHGEDELVYNDSMPDNRRHLYLTPTYVESTEGRATIKFWHRKKVMHTVTISEVPVLKMSSASLSTTTSDASLTQCADGVDSTTIDSGPSGTTLTNATVMDSGFSMSQAGNQAIPVYPNSTPADADGGPSGIFVGETAYDKILTERSLQCLVEVMSPQNCHRLLISLNVKDDVIKQKEKDSPGDNGTAMFNCFLTWKNSNGQKTSKQLYETLLEELGGIKRNDIKTKIEKVFTTNKELNKSDFEY